MCNTTVELLTSNSVGPTCEKKSLGTTNFSSRAQLDWAYEFLDRTGPDTQICRTGPARPD